MDEALRQKLLAHHAARKADPAFAKYRARVEQIKAIEAAKIEAGAAMVLAIQGMREAPSPMRRKSDAIERDRRAAESEAAIVAAWLALGRYNARRPYAQFGSK